MRAEKQRCLFGPPTLASPVRDLKCFAACTVFGQDELLLHQPPNTKRQSTATKGREGLELDCGPDRPLAAPGPWPRKRRPRPRPEGRRRWWWSAGPHETEAAPNPEALSPNSGTGMDACNSPNAGLEAGQVLEEGKRPHPPGCRVLCASCFGSKIVATAPESRNLGHSSKSNDDCGEKKQNLVARGRKETPKRIKALNPV